MSKSSQPANAPILESDITEFLNQSDDFSFEMSVLRELHSREIESSHGGTYTDPVTQKPRQYDVRATIKHAVEDSIDCKEKIIKFAVECKNISPANPVVISRSPRQVDECTIDLVRSVPHESSGYRRIYCSSRRVSCYTEGKMVGRSTSQLVRKTAGALADNDSPIYDKWAQAISSSFELIQQFNSLDVYRGNRGNISAIILPIVVIPDDTLWIVDYNSDGIRTVPRQANSCDYFIGKSSKVFAATERVEKFAEYKISHLQFFTLSGFSGFLDRLLVNQHAIDDLFGK